MLNNSHTHSHRDTHTRHTHTHRDRDLIQCKQWSVVVRTLHEPSVLLAYALALMLKPRELAQEAREACEVGSAFACCLGQLNMLLSLPVDP